MIRPSMPALSMMSICRSIAGRSSDRSALNCVVAAGKMPCQLTFIAESFKSTYKPQRQPGDFGGDPCAGAWGLPLNLLACLDRYRHHDGRGFVIPFDELNLFDFVLALRCEGQIADLLPAQFEGELGFRHVHDANVVGKVNAVLKRMILGFAVRIMQAHDHGYSALLAVRKSPAAHAA